jgi:hypothetical protein
MNSTTQQSRVVSRQIEAQAAAENRTSWFTIQAQKFEEGRFAWMAFMITFQTCLGSIACLHILQNDFSTVMLSATTGVTMAANAVMIAQGSAKVCLAAFYISTIINLSLIIYNLVVM